YLQASYGDPLDGSLSAEQRALGHFLRKTCEESLYFALLYARWMDEPGWSAVRQALFGGLPPVARDLLPRFVRRRVGQNLQGQGYGRHSRDEVYVLGGADLEALAIHLDGRAFAVADHPTSFDASLYSFLASVMRPPIEMPLKARALAERALCAYVERMETALAKAAQQPPEPVQSKP